MASTPSPQQVGREFVRQYYTMLHDAPHMLHRFYSSGSTFIHGGVDRPGHVEEPLIGQVEINKKIQQLSFKDCHTKIRQVDSQATIENAVVVQVTGELSNNGEPMRRFMQTFVLAPQTPKKYYVHNDIFRYQDEVYHDNSDTESEDQQQHPQPNHESSSVEYYQPQSSLVVVNTQTTSINEVTYVSPPPPQPIVSQQEALPQRVLRNEQEQQQQQVNGHQLTEITAETNVVQVNGDDNENDDHDGNVSTTIAVEQEKVVVEESVKEEQVSTPVTVVEQPKELPPQQPSSWAKIISNHSIPPTTSNLPTAPRVGNTTSLNVSSTTATAQATVAPVAVQQTPPQQPKNQKSSTKENQRNDKSSRSDGFNNQSSSYNGRSSNSGGGGGGGSRGGNRGSIQREQQQQRNNSNDVQSSNQNDDNTKFSRHPDAHQVFVGNLQSDISEAELSNYFSQYGAIIDVRINKNTKQQADRRLPNYGFIVFESKDSVENLLRNSNNKNLIFKDDKGVEHRLNIEEKRARNGGGGGGNKHSGGGGGRSSSNGSKGGRPTGVSKRTNNSNHNNSNNNTINNNTNSTTNTNNNGRRP